MEGNLEGISPRKCHWKKYRVSHWSWYNMTLSKTPILVINLKASWNFIQAGRASSNHSLASIYWANIKKKEVSCRNKTGAVVGSLAEIEGQKNGCLDCGWKGLGLNKPKWGLGSYWE